MRPSHATKQGRRYRYYVSADLIEGSVATGASGWRIPAEEIETALGRAIAARLRGPEVASTLIGRTGSGARDPHAALARLTGLADALADGSHQERSRLLRTLVCSVQLSESSLEGEIALWLHDAADLDSGQAHRDGALPIRIQAPIRLVRRGAGLRLILQGASASRAVPDPNIISTILAARRLLADYTDPVDRRSLTEVAGRGGLDAGDVSRLIQLAFLAPDIVERILDGVQPAALTAQRLKRLGDLPLLWHDQRELLS